MLHVLAVDAVRGTCIPEPLALRVQVRTQINGFYPKPYVRVLYGKKVMGTMYSGGEGGGGTARGGSGTGGGPGTAGGRG